MRQAFSIVSDIDALLQKMLDSKAQIDYNIIVA